PIGGAGLEPAPSCRPYVSGIRLASCCQDRREAPSGRSACRAETWPAIRPPPLPLGWELSRDGQPYWFERKGHRTADPGALRRYPLRSKRSYVSARKPAVISGFSGGAKLLIAPSPIGSQNGCSQTDDEAVAPAPSR